MAAHGALVSLMQVLTALQLQPLDDGFFARRIPSLTEKVSFLLDFLENSSRNTGMMASLEKSIGDAASAAEDLIIEPQLNEVLVSQLLSASRKEKSVMFHMIHMLIENLIPALKRAKSWVAEDLMFGAATIPFFVISWVLKHLVFETAAFLFSWVVDPIMYVIEPLMFGAAKHLVHVISSMVEYLMFEAAKFLVKVISWLLGRLIVEAATYLFENVIFMGAEIVGPALIRVLLPVILKNVLSAIVKNSIYGPLKHNTVAVYHSTILLLVIRVFESIIEEVDEIRGEEEETNVLPLASVFPRHDFGRTDFEMVGLESDLATIREQLASSSMKREIVSIVGMGGIGKTTLARRVHDDSYIASHFDIRAWVAVSQEYSVRNVLLGILESAKILTQESQELQQASDEKLALSLYQNLKGRRYLIVMDDVWDTEIWDSVRRSFPDDYNGSRVLLTTRLSDVALYANSGNPLHQMRFLTDNQSWTLLCQKAFGNTTCLLELEEIGKEIARNCKGLPLTIVVIGGLLLKENRTQANWRNIAENLNLMVSEEDDKCLEILGLSYNHLPHHLKPCFLYMGLFPEDCEIPISKLISLWIAEGFLKPSESKSLEEVAEEHVKDLIERSLILVGKHSSIGKVKTCYIHDLLRQVCILYGKKENFFHVVNSDGYLTQQGAKLHRRLSLHPNTLHSKTSCDLLTSYSLVRSLLCISKHLTSPSDFSIGFKLVRVLDIVVVQFRAFPEEIVKLVHLRYLGFNCNGLLPPSIAELRNLQTIVHQNWTFGWYSFLPSEIWSMSNLRHLYIKLSCLPDPLDDEALPLENLKSLEDVRNMRFTRSIVGRIPNVKTLGVLYDVSPSVDWSEYQLESLVDLHQLEVLKIVMKNLNPVANAPRFVFPRNLKELTLSGCRIPWESMTVVGEMPDLQVLKLRRNACSGLAWEPVEGEFGKLKHLLLEEMDLIVWRSDESHFPCLQSLIIRSCYRLEEIPSDIGEISTLELIELVDCLPTAVESAMEIQENQESMITSKSTLTRSHISRTG